LRRGLDAHALRPIFSFLPVKDDEGGHHGDVQHEDDDDDDDERAVRAADVGRVAVVAAAVLGREVGVARRLGVGSALGEVTRALSAWQEWLLHDVLADGESQPEVHVFGQQVALAAELAAVRKDARLRGAGRSVARFVRFGRSILELGRNSEVCRWIVFCFVC